MEGEEEKERHVVESARGCSDPILLCRAHGSNCSQFPDEGPVLTPLLSLVDGIHHGTRSGTTKVARSGSCSWSCPEYECNHRR